MPRNATTGVYSAPSNSWNPAVGGTVIDPDDWNDTQDDYVDGLNSIPHFANNGVIDDTAGNELIEFGVTASAVNHIRIANAAAGNDPGITAVGGDTDIDLVLTGKGAGGLIVTVTNTGLHILDTDASHDLIIAPGSNLAADRTLTLTTGDSDRTVTISGNATISQDYSATGSPTFANPVVTSITVGNTGLHLLDTNASHDLIIAPGSDLAADRTLTITTGDSNRTLTLSGDATLVAGTAAVLSGTQTLTGGFTVTPYSAGTKSSGTYTPLYSDGNFQTAVNGGAHTLAPPADNCTMIIQYTNNGSAGAITTSGFTKVDGSFTTTNGDDFFCNIIKVGSFSYLSIVRLQ